MKVLKRIFYEEIYSSRSENISNKLMYTRHSDARKYETNWNFLLSNKMLINVLTVLIEHR